MPNEQGGPLLAIEKRRAARPSRHLDKGVVAGRNEPDTANKECTSAAKRHPTAPHGRVIPRGSGRTPPFTREASLLNYQHLTGLSQVHVNLGPILGRLAQRESTRFTRAGSLVQSQYRPPFPARLGLRGC